MKAELDPKTNALIVTPGSETEAWALKQWLDAAGSYVDVMDIQHYAWPPSGPSLGLCLEPRPLG